MKNTKLQLMTKIGILSAMSFILMYFEFPIPFLFPDFLKIDFADIPALLGAFAMGPVAGVAIELIKNMLNFIMKSTTGGVGELANFITGAALVFPAGYFYRKSKTKKSALMGLMVGTIAMSLVMSFANYFILIPFYFKVAPSQEYLPMILTGILPFNLFKGVLISILTLLMYKKVSPILHK